MFLICITRATTIFAHFGQLFSSNFQKISIIKNENTKLFFSAGIEFLEKFRYAKQRHFV